MWSACLAKLHLGAGRFIGRHFSKQHRAQPQRLGDIARTSRGEKNSWGRMLYEVYAEVWLTLAAAKEWDATRDDFVTQALQLGSMKVPRLSRRNRRQNPSDMALALNL